MIKKSLIERLFLNDLKSVDEGHVKSVFNIDKEKRNRYNIEFCFVISGGLCYNEHTREDDHYDKANC